jgi:hypothetical protein
MLSVERAWQMSNGELRRPRQIFITKSQVLATRVEEYYEKLRTSLEVAHLRPNDLVNVASLPDEIPARRAVLRSEDLDTSRADLPLNFNALADDHFPLFITYHKVCMLFLQLICFA